MVPCPGWYLSVIYGNPSPALRRFLWADLHSGLIHPSSPCLVFGDFNSVNSIHKVSSKNLDHRRCAAFNAWILTIILWIWDLRDLCILGLVALIQTHSRVIT